MTKLFQMALIAACTLLTQNAIGQSVILINGQPTKVVLKGNEIESIVNTKIDTYLQGYEQEPVSNFKYAQFRAVETPNKIKTIKKDPFFPKSKDLSAVEPSNF